MINLKFTFVHWLVMLALLASGWLAGSLRPYDKRFVLKVIEYVSGALMQREGRRCSAYAPCSPFPFIYLTFSGVHLWALLVV